MQYPETLCIGHVCQLASGTINRTTTTPSSLYVVLDLVHWARMPVSLWNDKPYDNYAIFTVRCADGVVAWWRGGVVAWWRGGVVASLSVAVQYRLNENARGSAGRWW